MTEESTPNFSSLHTRAQTLLDTLAGIMSAEWLGVEEGAIDPETGLPLQNQDGVNPLTDPETGFPLQGPAEAPVDVVALRSQVTGLEGQMAALDGKANDAVRIASSLEGKVNTALSVAQSAFRQAMEAKSIAQSAKYNSVVQSDMETPDYVKGGGPQ